MNSHDVRDGGERRKRETTIVRLNVYDMYWINGYVSNFGIGVYHSGVEVHGIEYSYALGSGVFGITPREASQLGEEYRFRESIVLGFTELSKKDVRKVLKALSEHYTSDSYHLITQNCNHFATTFARCLCGVEPPAYVNRLATIGSRVPFLAKIVRS